MVRTVCGQAAPYWPAIEFRVHPGGCGGGEGMVVVVMIMVMDSVIAQLRRS